MGAMSLDLSSLRSAIRQLQTSLAYAHSPMAAADPGLGEQLRNSVIQCFELSYELSWKMLKRHLEATEANPAALDQINFQDLIRLGNERGPLRSDCGALEGLSPGPRRQQPHLQRRHGPTCRRPSAPATCRFVCSRGLGEHRCRLQGRDRTPVSCPAAPHRQPDGQITCCAGPGLTWRSSPRLAGPRRLRRVRRSAAGTSAAASRASRHGPG